ncbi:Uncharacterised protein [Trueperella bialowiezensis]|uniref:Uncharacterized protein n=1 Tax=Trueperella bialowiezensis TaxID=312285 RepID=A0A448PFF8_9ACTO|nr:Uncharacterised protein [Trueperella bialowiezensis]
MAFFRIHTIVSVLLNRLGKLFGLTAQQPFQMSELLSNEFAPAFY